MKLMYSSEPNTLLFKELSDAILIHKSKPTMIFLCGGSTVNFYKYFVEKFNSFLDYAKSVGVTDFSKLIFGLTDDRWFEDKSNPIINFNQINETGFYKLFIDRGADFLKMSISDDLYRDAQDYDSEIKTLINDHYKILIGGVGENGHTCGILPQESKEIYDEMYGGEKYAVAVQVNDIDRYRITLTPNAISLMDECLLYITSENKRDILNTLMYEDRELWQMPSQIYKNLNNVKIFTDII